MTKRLIMTKGLPGSGKSTWAREIVEYFPPGQVVRVNKDDLRAMLHNGQWAGNKTERQIIASQEAVVAAAFAQNSVHTVILDDTGFGHDDRVKALAEKHGAEFVIQDFTDVPLKVCIERDANRTVGHVGKKVINRMHLRHLAKPWEPPKHDHRLPHAIIVDIDGTLAHMTGRSPYDYSAAVLQDAVDPVVRGIVTAWFNNTPEGYVFIVSGRKNEARQHTLAWLEQHGIPFDYLLMRKDRDDRDDTIVKGEIFEEHIEGQYNVNFVLDDRQKVVDMWRERGLKCLQVEPGDF